MTEFPLPHNSADLRGRVAFVTGTTSGLGRRFADVLGACGAKVHYPGAAPSASKNTRTNCAAEGLK